MTGKIAFEAWGNIDPKFILEAAPDADKQPVAGISPNGAKKKGSRPPFHSGWIAAAVCAVVALGVYLGVLWMGQDEWRPPATTNDEIANITEPTVTDPEETTEEPLVTEPEETLPPDDGLAEPSPTFANKHYMVEEIDGQLYLNFYTSLYTSQNEYGGLIIVPFLKFEDAEDMFTSLYYGELDDVQLRELSRFSKTIYGYQTIDLTRLATPVLEEGGSIQDVDYYGSYYTYHYDIPSISKPARMTIEPNKHKKGWAARNVAAQGKDTDTREETVIDGMSAVITTDHSSTSSWRTVYVSYADEATGVELYAHFNYLTSSHSSAADISETVPYKIEVIGTYKDWKYTVYTGLKPLAYKGTFEITKDFLLSFMIEPFDPPRVKPSAVMKKQAYEIIKEDGAWYLTFPEWDGTMPDGMLPPEGESIAMPSFENAKAMREILMGDDMSLYHQLLFKLNADEKRRVQIPNLDRLLVHTFPQNRHVTKPPLSITADGFYQGSTYYIDCSTHHYASFGVMSEAEWQKKRAEHFPVAGEDDVLSVNAVVEGTYDGLPCTFYEYTVEQPLENGVFVRCHIHPSDATRGQEYFFTYFVSAELLEWVDIPAHAMQDMQALHVRDVFVYGSWDGQHYAFSLCELEDPPTAATLTEFSVSPLIP